MAEAAWRWTPFLVAVTRAVRLTGAAFPTAPAQRLCRRSIAKGTEATFPPGDTPTALDIRAGMPCFRMNSRFRDVAGRPRASPRKASAAPVRITCPSRERRFTGGAVRARKQ